MRNTLAWLAQEKKAHGAYDGITNTITLTSADQVLNAVSLFWTLVGCNGVATHHAQNDVHLNHPIPED